MDVQNDVGRTVTSARVLDHDKSVIDVMERNEPLPSLLIQTAGRPLFFPRLIRKPDEEVPGLAPGETFTVAKPKSAP